MSIEAMKQWLEALEDLGMKHYENTGEVLYKETFTALRQAIAQPEQAQPVALPEGKQLILVDESFDELMYWLSRCEDKGHLENCADLVEPWKNFKYETYTTPPRQPEPLTDEEKDARRWRYMRQKHADWFELSARAKDIDFDGGLDEAVDEAIAAHGIKGEA